MQDTEQTRAYQSNGTKSSDVNRMAATCTSNELEFEGSKIDGSSFNLPRYFAEFMVLMAALFVATSIAVIVSRPASGNPKLITYKSLAGRTIETTYCKTACDNPCATYQSENGPLCCDFDVNAVGTSICVQRVTTSPTTPETCTCGLVELPRPASAVHPHTHHPPVGKTDDATNDNTIDDDDTENNWQPSPDGVGSKAFIITVPVHATPCTTTCASPCGYSGQYCCEMAPSGSCTITSINGDCFCGAD